MEKINLTKVSAETRKTIKKQVINLLKKKLADAADPSGPETDSADLFGYSVFRETNPLNRKKK